MQKINNVVVVGVATRAEINARFLRALETGKSQGAYRSFASSDELWQTLSPKRWAILQAMTGAGALALREVARRLARDVKGVHTDVHTLLNAGLLDKTAEGKLIFPFDAIHVDFMLKAA
ncbi:MAG: DNA-binding protein [Sideroxydans sp.]|nr:DNA-binding protein [Sideroxydans sp.]